MEKTIKLMSELELVSELFAKWDGKQKSWVTTKNERFQDYLEYGEDYELTPNEIKQFIKYDSKDNVRKILKNGLTYVYQNHTVTIKGDFRSVDVVATNHDLNEPYTHTLKANEKGLQEYVEQEKLNMKVAQTVRQITRALQKKA